jgi:hypothetical protein
MFHVEHFSEWERPKHFCCNSSVLFRLQLRIIMPICASFQRMGILLREGLWNIPGYTLTA